MLLKQVGMLLCDSPFTVIFLLNDIKDVAEIMDMNVFTTTIMVVWSEDI